MRGRRTPSVAVAVGAALLVPLLAPTVADAAATDVVINEIMYNPPSDLGRRRVPRAAQPRAGGGGRLRLVVRRHHADVRRRDLDRPERLPGGEPGPGAVPADLRPHGRGHVHRRALQRWGDDLAAGRHERRDRHRRVHRPRTVARHAGRRGCLAGARGPERREQRLPRLGRLDRGSGLDARGAELGAAQRTGATDHCRVGEPCRPRSRPGGHRHGHRDRAGHRGRAVPHGLRRRADRDAAARRWGRLHRADPGSRCGAPDPVPGRGRERRWHVARAPLGRHHGLPAPGGGERRDQSDQDARVVHLRRRLQRDRRQPDRRHRAHRRDRLQRPGRRQRRVQHPRGELADRAEAELEGPAPAQLRPRPGAARTRRRVRDAGRLERQVARSAEPGVGGLPASRGGGHAGLPAAGAAQRGLPGSLHLHRPVRRHVAGPRGVRREHAVVQGLHRRLRREPAAGRGAVGEEEPGGRRLRPDPGLPRRGRAERWPPNATTCWRPPTSPS